MLNLIDPQLIGYAVTSTALAGVGLRSIFQHAVIGGALKKEQPAIKKFSTDTRAQFTPAVDAPKANLENLGKLIGKAGQDRAFYISEMEKLKSEPIKDPPSDQILNDLWVTMGKGLLMNYTLIELYDFSSTYGDHIKTMATEGAKATAHHTPTVLHFADAKIIELLDKTGITDAVIQATHQATVHMSQHTMEIGAKALHTMLYPGVVSGLITLGQESWLAINGENNWEDALTYGALPAIGTVAMIKVGAAAGLKADLACGGLTHGWGTLCGTLAGIGGSIFMREKFIGDQIDGDKVTLKPHTDKIKEQKAKGNKAVNTIILAKNADLDGLQASCPDITRNEKLREIFGKVAHAAQADFQAASDNVTLRYNLRVNALPEKSWWEKMMFLNRNAPIQAAYRDAANGELQYLKQASDKFVKACGENPTEVVDMLIDGALKNNGELKTILEFMLDDLKAAAGLHDSSMKQWGTSCKTHWEETQAAVKGEADQQNAIMTELRKKLAPLMAPLKARIKANCTRLGRSPDPILSV